MAIHTKDDTDISAYVPVAPGSPGSIDEKASDGGLSSAEHQLGADYIDPREERAFVRRPSSSPPCNGRRRYADWF